MGAVFHQETSFSFELIVVDSGSDDGTLEILSGYPAKVHAIPAGEFGHGKTRNRMAGMASGKVLVFMTHDAVPNNAHWLEELVRTILNGQATAAYSRQVPRPTTDPINAFFLNEMYPASGGPRSANPNGPSLRDVFFSNASSAMLKSALLEEPFADDIIMAEDQEWCARMLRKGATIYYAAESEVEHAHHYDLVETFRRYFDSGVSYRDVFRTRGKAPALTRDFVGGGVPYLGRMLRYLASVGRRRLIPKAVLVSLVKFTAAFLGQHHRWFPRPLKRRLSWHAYYWRRPRPDEVPIAGVPADARGREGG